MSCIQKAQVFANLHVILGTISFLIFPLRKITLNYLYTKRTGTKYCLRETKYLHWPVDINVWKQRLLDSPQEFSVEHQNLLLHSWRTLGTQEQKSK